MFSKMKSEQIQEANKFYRMEEIPMTKDVATISLSTLTTWHEYEYLPKLKAHSDRNHIIDVYMGWCEANVKEATTPLELKNAEKILAEWKEFARIHSDKMHEFVRHSSRYFRSGYDFNAARQYCKITWNEKHEVILIPV